MVFADLPYGRTKSAWDHQVSLPEFWVSVRHVLASRGVVVLTSIQPYTSQLVVSNEPWFRLSMVWAKNKSSGFLNAGRAPLRAHEDVLVFAPTSPRYHPQRTDGHAPSKASRRRARRGVYGAHDASVYDHGKTTRCATSVLSFPVVNGDDPARIHAAQKPVDLVRWFVRAYTRSGDLVVDPVTGSGTTLVAAVREGRRAVGFEVDPAIAARAAAWLGAL